MTSAGDFLKKDARTPLEGNFHAAGVTLSIATNAQSILDGARESFKNPCDPLSRAEVKLRLWVDPSGGSAPPWPKPYFRGLGHLVFTGFDARNSLLIDLRTRTVLGRFTSAMATDHEFWKKVIFPVLLGTLSASVGLTLLHCACVALEGSGVLLAGESGSGKSTLSLALAQAGFHFLSDDRTLVSQGDGIILAWNLATCLKLRPDAAKYFPDLQGLEPNEVLNGERVFHFDPERHLRVPRVRCCEPRWILFLERHSEPTFALTEVPPGEAVGRLEAGLARENADAIELQRKAICTLVERGCWALRYGGDPHTVARAVQAFIAGQGDSRRPPPRVVLNDDACPPAPRPDPLRRFTHTPLAADLRVMNRTVRVETNSPLVLSRVRQAFDGYGQASNTHPQFRWRIVSESDGLSKPPWPEMTAFSDRSRRYVNLGQRSFIAVDLDSREAIGFLPEELVKDETGFPGIFLAAIFYVTAAALGLTPVSAACVALGEKGLLVFGVPNSGKTTSSFLAGKLGLEFQADQATFLECDHSRLHAWGDFWPAAFRVETAQFLPELSSLTRPLFHRSATFLSMEKRPRHVAGERSVEPTACLFLEREAAETPRLIPLSPRELGGRLTGAVPFKDDAGSEGDHQAVFRALGELPAYRLLYGSDPAVAALFLRSVLSTHHLVEKRA